jgi:hypothetical protein
MLALLGTNNQRPRRGGDAQTPTQVVHQVAKPRPAKQNQNQAPKTAQDKNIGIATQPCSSLSIP